MLIDIKKLADIIATHTLLQMERQLRFIGISVRQPRSGSSRHEILEKDQCIFKLAHAFITKLGKPDENWRASRLCFEQLYHWFENTAELDHHDQLAMMSWACQLDQLLSGKILPNSIISLASAYYAEPYKFAAFLYWLIDNDAAFDNIIRSDILQQYFAYHAFEITVIQNTYALLSNLSDRIHHFISYLENINCGMRGFINNRQEDDTCYSYNVCGQFFSHTDLFFESLLTAESITLLTHQSTHLSDIAETLFYLFDWTLIQKLTIDTESNSRLIETLLQSTAKQKILSEFSSGVLNGQFSKEFAKKIFVFIGETLSTDAVLALVVSEPFYLHAMLFLLNIHCFEPYIKNSIVGFCAQEKYHTLAHLPFLASLIQMIKQMRHDENWGAEIQALLNMILGIILPHENNLHDNDITSINPVLGYLTPLLAQKIEDYKKNIDAAIAQFIQGEIDFDAITQVWSSQLSCSNVLFHLAPTLSRNTLYPRTIYQLHSRILQMQYAFCIEKNIEFPLSNLLLACSPELATQKRILQETLVNHSTGAQLIGAILDYSFSCDIGGHIVLHPFGDTRSILFHAFTLHDQEFQRILFRKILIPPNLFTVMETVIQENLIEQLNIIWDHLQLDVLVSTTILKLFLDYFQNSYVDSKTHNVYFERIRFLLDNLKHTKISEDLLVIAFQQGIKYDRDRLVKTLCMFDHPNQLSKAVIQKERIKAATEHKAWRMVGLLCGLSGDPHFNAQFIQPNNVPLYFQLITEYKTTHPLNSVAEALQYQNDNIENLLHLAAKYCTADQVKQFFREFRLVFKPIKLDQLLNAQSNIMKQIPTCTRSTPDAEEINYFLNEMRQTYSDFKDDTDDSTDLLPTPPPQQRVFTFFPIIRAREEEENNVPGPVRPLPPLESDELDRFFRL